MSPAKLSVIFVSLCHITYLAGCDPAPYSLVGEREADKINGQRTQLVGFEKDHSVAVENEGIELQVKGSLYGGLIWDTKVRLFLQVINRSKKSVEIQRSAVAIEMDGKSSEESCKDIRMFSRMLDLEGMLGESPDQPSDTHVVDPGQTRFLQVFAYCRFPKRTVHVKVDMSDKVKDTSIPFSITLRPLL